MRSFFHYLPQTHAFAIVTASLSLTEAGFSQWSTALERLFSYLRLLREKGVPAHAFSDAQALVALGFQYAEPSQPQQFVTSTAGGMPLYKPEDWLKGPSLIQVSIYSSIYLPTYLSIYLPTYLLIYLPVYLSTSIQLSIYLSIYLSFFLPTYLPTYIPIHLSIYIHIYIYVYLYSRSSL